MATYVLFRDNIKHDERCTFELYHRGDPDDPDTRPVMAGCGEPAIGRRGREGFLCEEHFYYSAKMEGVGDYRINYETGRTE